MIYENIIDVGDEIPGFELESQLGRIVYRDIIFGKWSLLVTFGNAFEPTATTDLGTLCKMKEEFEARNIFIVAVGNDTVPNYRTWIKDIEEFHTSKVGFAILSDPYCNTLKMLGCARESLANKGIAQPSSAGVFLIDLDARVRYSSRTSLSVGRNWYEVLRQFDALLLVTLHPVITPCNWGQGQQVMIRKDVQTKDSLEYNAVELKPWFRLAPCPDKI